jgi:aspartate/methionine/tyrosine aminotransferase
LTRVEQQDYDEAMNTLAQQLNQILDKSIIGSCLSDYGRMLYFPEGIVAQAMEATKSAHRFNSTVGMAYKDGEPMILPTIQDNLPRLTAMEAVGYAPTAGNLKLRNVWKEALLQKNPQVDPARITLPAVTNGITGAMALAGELFCSPGDHVFYPELCWDNYDLMYETRFLGQVHCFPFYDTNGTLNIQGVSQLILETVPPGEKAILILNFPHNPTGYSPTRQEAQQWHDELVRVASNDRKLIVIFDDAYFGLFYEEFVYPHSLFNLLAQAHQNIIAVKCDGASKEDYVWGFRVGFFTVGFPGLDESVKEALETKVKGAIRASISSGSQVSQSILYKELTSLVYQGVKQAFAEELKKRYKMVQDFLSNREKHSSLKVLPFNSGYFMCFHTGQLDANELRKKLLAEEGIGTIALGKRYLRVTFASIDAPDLIPLYETIFKTADKMR